jgi:hypothetical protein
MVTCTNAKDQRVWPQDFEMAARDGSEERWMAVEFERTGRAEQANPCYNAQRPCFAEDLLHESK